LDYVYGKREKIDNVEIAVKLNVEWLDRGYGQSNWSSDHGLVMFMLHGQNKNNMIIHLKYTN